LTSGVVLVLADGLEPDRRGNSVQDRAGSHF
jgi:hypothetical protein